MRLCAWEGFGANARLAVVTSRTTICFIIGPSGDPTRLRVKIVGQTAYTPLGSDDRYGVKDAKTATMAPNEIDKYAI
jgi:hypothetical protein